MTSCYAEELPRIPPLPPHSPFPFLCARSRVHRPRGCGFVLVPTRGVGTVTMSRVSEMPPSPNEGRGEGLGGAVPPDLLQPGEKRPRVNVKRGEDDMEKASPSGRAADGAATGMGGSPNGAPGAGGASTSSPPLHPGESRRAGEGKTPTLTEGTGTVEPKKAAINIDSIFAPHNFVHRRDHFLKQVGYRWDAYFVCNYICPRS